MPSFLPLAPFGAVSTLISMHLTWMFDISDRCVLMVGITGFMITVTAANDCRLSAVVSSAGCIGLGLALSFGVTKRIVSTRPSCAVQKKKQYVSRRGNC